VACGSAVADGVCEGARLVLHGLGSACTPALGSLASGSFADQGKASGVIKAIMGLGRDSRDSLVIDVIGYAIVW